MLFFKTPAVEFKFQSRLGGKTKALCSLFCILWKMGSVMRKLFLCAAAVLAGCCGPKPVELDSSVREEIALAVGEAIDEGNIPGAVVCVSSRGKTVYLEAFGNSSVVPDTVAMTTGTMFDLASVSKCVGTTLSFMQLVEQGKVSPGDKVSDYIPSFKPWTDPETGETEDITVQDLMTHSSGLAGYVSDTKGFIAEHGSPCPEAVVEYIATGSGRRFRPGTDYLYSCLNFITLQAILEKVTGEPLWEYAERNVFGRLSLRHTCYFPLEDDCLTPRAHKELKDLCAPTQVVDGEPLKAAVHDPMARLLNAGNSGNAGVFSNAEDLAAICNALLYPPRGRKRIISPETIALMRTVPPDNDPSVGRALGWDSQSRASVIKGSYFNPETVICHTGYTGTSVVVDFETGTVVIILANRVHPEDKGDCRPLRIRIADIVGQAVKGSL
jgi:CubicO group peptidase (beta-lactamase class C family)